MTPSSIKPVIDFQEKAALFVGVVDVDVEAAVEVDVGVDDDEEVVEEAEEVAGMEGKVNVGCRVAMLQNCCPRLSIVATWSEQLANTQSTISAG